MVLLLLPGLAFIEGRYTGMLVNVRQTREHYRVGSRLADRPLGEFDIGGSPGEAPGIYVGIVGLVAGISPTTWLWVRTRQRRAPFTCA